MVCVEGREGVRGISGEYCAVTCALYLSVLKQNAKIPYMTARLHDSMPSLFCKINILKKVPIIVTMQICFYLRPHEIYGRYRRY